MSKRQLELKIAEIAVKVKQSDDTMKVWHLRPDFEHMLFSDAEEGEEGEEGSADEDNGKKASSSSSSSSLAGGGGKAKRKREEPPSKAAEGGPNGGAKPARKLRRAFQWFVKATREEAQKVCAV